MCAVSLIRAVHGGRVYLVGVGEQPPGYVAERRGKLSVLRLAEHGFPVEHGVSVYALRQP